jgi:phosphatidylglycerol:prolipoprotein diacylglycerol transferase
MLPYFQIGSYQLPTYGLTILIGFALGILVAVKRPAISGLQRDDIFYSFLYGAIGTVVGAKLLYLAITLPVMMRSASFVFSWDTIVELLRYGFVFYGGVIGAILGFFLYAKHISCIFSAFGKMRCRRFLLFIPSDASVVFWQDAATENRWILHGGILQSRIGCACGVALFPVQLLESGINLVLFFLLFAYSRKPRREGQILGFYLAFYAVERFFLEYLRYDEIRGIFLGLSTSQWISLILLPCWTVFTVEKKK